MKKLLILILIPVLSQAQTTVIDSTEFVKIDTTITKKKGWVIKTTTIDSVFEDEAPVNPGRSGLFYTPEEIEIWKGRQDTKDWERIADAAKTFFSDPIKDRWTTFYKGSGCIPKGPQTEPKKIMDNIHHAAFYYLITQELAYAQAVKKELFWYANNPDLEFRKSRYCDSNSDGNPVFFIAAGMVRLLYAYDYIKEILTESEKTVLNKWFLRAAIRYQEMTDNDLDKLYTNRSQGVLSNTGKQLLTGADDRPYENGPYNTGVGRWYNNRRGDQIRFAFLVGIFLDYQPLIQAGEKYFREWLIYAVYPDGTQMEHHRGYQADEKGLHYAMISTEQMIDIADALARKGDNSLYEFNTMEGYGPSKGGQKSLESVMINLCRYYDGSHRPLRFWKGEIQDAQKMPDNVQNRHDVWLAKGNLYYRNAYIEGTYMRTNPGTKKYSGREHSDGAYSAATGHYNQKPGSLFLYAETGAWPYSTGREAN